MIGQRDLLRKQIKGNDEDSAQENKDHESAKNKSQCEGKLIFWMGNIVSSHVKKYTWIHFESQD